MKKNRKYSIPTKYIFPTLAITCIAFMFASFISGYSGGVGNTIAGYIFVPVQSGINQVGGWFRDKADNLQDLTEAQAKNDELQAKIDELTLENSQLQQDKYELDELRELYKLDETYGDYNKMQARIISKDAGNWFSTFVIDKGSKDGIAVDMNVIAGSGLVGIVTKVGNNWAQVRSIIDDLSNVSAKVLSTSDLCFIKGDLQLMNDGLIRVIQLKDTEDLVSKGDEIVTSHISNKYLEGILIGYINEVTMDSNNLTKSGTITPAVDFDHLHTVLVITDLKYETE